MHEDVNAAGTRIPRVSILHVLPATGDTRRPDTQRVGRLCARTIYANIVRFAFWDGPENRCEKAERISDDARSLPRTKPIEFTTTSLDQIQDVRVIRNGDYRRKTR